MHTSVCVSMWVKYTTQMSTVASLICLGPSFQKMTHYFCFMGHYGPPILKKTPEALREEEPHNNHKTPGREKTKQSALYFPHQDECKTRTGIEQRTPKHRTTTESHNGRNNQQRITNNRGAVDDLIHYCTRPSAIVHQVVHGTEG